MKKNLASRLLCIGAIAIPAALRLLGETLPENYISGWFRVLTALVIVTATASLAIYMAAFSMHEERGI